MADSDAFEAAATEKQPARRLVIRLTETSLEFSMGAHNRTLTGPEMQPFREIGMLTTLYFDRRYGGLGGDLRQIGADLAATIRDLVGFELQTGSELTLVEVVTPTRLSRDLASIPWESLEERGRTPIAYARNVWISRRSGSSPSDRKLSHIERGGLRVLIAAPGNALRKFAKSSEGERRIVKAAGEEVANIGGLLDLLVAENLADFRVLGPSNVVSLENVRKELRDFCPHLFHFIGHSTVLPSGADTIFYFDCNQAPPGSTATIEAHERDFLAMLLNLENQPDLVLLNSCKSIGDQIASGLPRKLQALGIANVIGMRWQICSEAAVSFATTLYKSLAGGASVGDAVQLARRCLALQDGEFGDWFLPVLYSSTPHRPLLRINGVQRPGGGRILAPLPSARRIPFKGKLAYEETDAPYFAGRDDDFDAFMSRLNEVPLLVIHGGSRVGKTSLIRAQFLPACVRSGHLAVYIDLARPRAFEDWLKVSSATANESPEGQVRAESPTILVLDHLERPLFTPGFTEQLMRLVASRPAGQKIVFVLPSWWRDVLRRRLRADGISDLAEYELFPLSRAGWRQIVLQAKRWDFELALEVEALVLKEIELAEAEPGRNLALPHLSLLLEQLYMLASSLATSSSLPRISQGLYEQIGGLGGVVLRTYRHFLDGFDPQDQKAIQRILAEFAPEPGWQEDAAEKRTLEALSGLPSEQFYRLMMELERAYVLRRDSQERLELAHPAFETVAATAALERMNSSPSAERLRRARIALTSSRLAWEADGLPLTVRKVEQIEGSFAQLNPSAAELAHFMGSAYLRDRPWWRERLHSLNLDQQRELVAQLKSIHSFNTRLCLLSFCMELPPLRRGLAPLLASTLDGDAAAARYGSERILVALFRKRNPPADFSSADLILRQLNETAPNDGRFAEQLDDLDLLEWGYLPSNWYGLSEAWRPDAQLPWMPSLALFLALVWTVSWFFAPTTGWSLSQFGYLLYFALVFAGSLFFASRLPTCERLFFDPASPVRRQTWKQLVPRHFNIAVVASVSAGFLSFMPVGFFVQERFNAMIEDGLFTFLSALAANVLAEPAVYLPEYLLAGAHFAALNMLALASSVVIGMLIGVILLLPLSPLTLLYDYASSHWPIRRSAVTVRSILGLLTASGATALVGPLSLRAAGTLAEIATPYIPFANVFFGSGGPGQWVANLHALAGSPHAPWLYVLGPLFAALVARHMGGRKLRLRLYMFFRLVRSNAPQRLLWPLMAEGTVEAVETAIQLLKHEWTLRDREAFDWLCALAGGNPLALPESSIPPADQTRLSERAKELLKQIDWSGVNAEGRDYAGTLEVVMGRRRLQVRFAERWRAVLKTLAHDRGWALRLLTLLGWLSALILLIGVFHVAAFFGLNFLDLTLPLQARLGFPIFDFSRTFDLLEAVFLTYSCLFVSITAGLLVRAVWKSCMHGWRLLSRKEEKNG